jgi:mRNA interferase MazF
MKRGEVFAARLDPAEGSEQAGVRPVVIVSRNAINDASPVVVVVPLTSSKRGRRLYPSHVAIRASDGGLRVDSVALAEQVRAISKTRLGDLWGALSETAMRRIDRALMITLDLSEGG